MELLWLLSVYLLLGLIIYVDFINPSFMTVLENSAFWGQNLNLGLVVFALAIEGIASSVICSFILMQYYKNYKTSVTICLNYSLGKNTSAIIQRALPSSASFNCC